MDTTTLIGVIGATLLLLAFIGNAVGKMEHDGTGYIIINLVGGVFLVWYASLIGSWPFIVIESVWAIVAFRGLWEKLAGGGKTR